MSEPNPNAPGHPRRLLDMRIGTAEDGTLLITGNNRTSRVIDVVGESRPAGDGEVALVVTVRMRARGECIVGRDGEAVFLEEPASAHGDAAEEALDAIGQLCGAPRWLYPGQVVRDVAHALKPWMNVLGVVRNNALDEEPVGGCTLSLYYDPDTKRYNADVEAGEANVGVEAPTLELALAALEYCDEGEGVTVDADGVPVCRECIDEPEGFPCEYCENTRRDRHPPHAWPKDGLRSAE